MVQTSYLADSAVHLQPTSKCNHGVRLADPAVNIQPPVTATGLVIPHSQLSTFSHQ